MNEVFGKWIEINDESISNILKNDFCTFTHLMRNRITYFKVIAYSLKYSAKQKNTNNPIRILNMIYYPTSTDSLSLINRLTTCWFHVVKCILRWAKFLTKWIEIIRNASIEQLFHLCRNRIISQFCRKEYSFKVLYRWLDRNFLDNPYV